jgi:hypothetical protein
VSRLFEAEEFSLTFIGRPGLVSASVEESPESCSQSSINDLNSQNDIKVFGLAIRQSRSREQKIARCTANDDILIVVRPEVLPEFF